MFDKVWVAVADKLSPANVAALALLLATAIGSSLVTYFRTTERASLSDFLAFAFPPEVLAHPSARADFVFWITKKLLQPLIYFPAGVTFVVAVGYGTRLALMKLFGIDHVETAPAGPVLILVFTATMLLAYDLSYYLYHWAQHRVPFLWELHKVHHSAEVLVGVTKDRVHPVDELMNRAWDGLIPGICYGLWSFAALDPVEVTVFGLNVYVMRNILMMDFVRHTHLPISFGPIDHVVISPHAHQLHHSVARKHWDKNFGLMFTFWDRLFGTFRPPEPAETFKFGLIERDRDQYQSLSGLYLLPLRKMWSHVGRRRRAATPKAADARTGEVSLGEAER